MHSAAPGPPRGDRPPGRVARWVRGRVRLGHRGEQDRHADRQQHRRQNQERSRDAEIVDQVTRQEAAGRTRQRGGQIEEAVAQRAEACAVHRGDAPHRLNEQCADQQTWQNRMPLRTTRLGAAASSAPPTAIAARIATWTPLH